MKAELWKGPDGELVLTMPGAKARGDVEEAGFARVGTVNLEIAEALMEVVDKPNLGLATTLELIQELNARADMARYAEGGEWTRYRTVDS